MAPRSAFQYSSLYAHTCTSIFTTPIIITVLRSYLSAIQYKAPGDVYQKKCISVMKNTSSVKVAVSLARIFKCGLRYWD